MKRNKGILNQALIPYVKATQSNLLHGKVCHLPERSCLSHKQPSRMKSEYRNKIYIFLIVASIVSFATHIFYGLRLLYKDQDYGHDTFKKVHSEYNATFFKCLLSLNQFNTLIFGINKEEKGPKFGINEYLHLESYLKKAFIGQHIALNQVLMQFQQLLTSYDKPVVYWHRLWVWNLIGDTGLGKSHLINALSTALEQGSCANIIYGSLFDNELDELERNVIKRLRGGCFNFVILEEVRDRDHVLETSQLTRRHVLLVDRLGRRPSRDFPTDSAIVVVAMATWDPSVERLNKAYAHHVIHSPTEHVIRTVRSQLTGEWVEPFAGGPRRQVTMPFLPFHNFHVIDCIVAHFITSGRVSEIGEVDIRSWPYFAKVNMTQVTHKGCKNIKAIYSSQHYITASQVKTYPE